MMDYKLNLERLPMEQQLMMLQQLELLRQLERFNVSVKAPVQPVGKITKKQAKRIQKEWIRRSVSATGAAIIAFSISANAFAESSKSEIGFENRPKEMVAEHPSIEIETKISVKHTHETEREKPKTPIDQAPIRMTKAKAEAAATKENAIPTPEPTTPPIEHKPLKKLSQDEIKTFESWSTQKKQQPKPDQDEVKKADTEVKKANTIEIEKEEPTLDSPTKVNTSVPAAKSKVETVKPYQVNETIEAYASTKTDDQEKQAAIAQLERLSTGNLTVAQAVSKETGIPKAEAEKDVHVVEKGDTLWELAVKHYGDGALWVKIWEANKTMLIQQDERNAKDPGHWIYPGQSLRIPTRS